MKVSAELAHDTRGLIANLNQTAPVDGQETTPATCLNSLPAETLAAPDYAGWMKRLQEMDDCKDVAVRLEQLVSIRRTSTTAGGSGNWPQNESTNP